MTPLLLLLLILPALPSAAAGGGCGSLDLRVESIGRHSATVSLIPPQRNTKNIRFEFSTGKQGLSTRPGPRALDRVSLHGRQGGRLVPPHTRGSVISLQSCPFLLNFSTFQGYFKRGQGQNGSS